MASPLIQALALGVKQEQMVKYTLVPGFTLNVFEWLLTLHLEVSLVWSAPWSGTKLLYFLTRYLPFIDVSILMYYQFGYALPQHVCEVSYQVFTWMFVIGQLIAVAILTLRTWAVCGKSKLSTYGLSGVYGLLLASTIILAALYLRVSTSNASPVPQLFGCIPGNASGSSYLASIYAILLVYDGGLLLVMVVQGVSALRVAGESRLTRVVYRDGIMYYICIFCLSLANAIVVLRLHDAHDNIMLATLERVIHAIVACRVVLHIREQGEMEKLGLLPSEQITGSLRFAQSNHRTRDPTVTGFSDTVDQSGSDSTY